MKNNEVRLMSDTTNTNTTTNGPKSVRIRTNIGWVSVPTTAAGGVDQGELTEAIAALKKELQAQLDDKLAKSDYLEGSLVDEILANTEV